MRVVMTPDDFLDRSVLQCESASRSRKEAKTVIRIRSPDACRPAQRPRLFSSKPGLSLPPILFLVSLTTTSTHVRSPPALPSPGIHRANRQRNPAHRLLCSDSVTDIPTDRPHKSPPPPITLTIPCPRVASPPLRTATEPLTRAYTPIHFARTQYTRWNQAQASRKRLLLSGFPCYAHPSPRDGPKPFLDTRKDTKSPSERVPVVLPSFGGCHSFFFFVPYPPRSSTEKPHPPPPSSPLPE